MRIKRSALKLFFRVFIYHGTDLIGTDIDFFNNITARKAKRRKGDIRKRDSLVRKKLRHQHVVNTFERVVVLISCIPHVNDPKKLQRRLFAGVRPCKTSRALGVNVKNAAHIQPILS